MAFCTGCGSRLTDQQEFCTNCGQENIREQSNEQQEVNFSKQEKEKRSRNLLSKGWIITLLSLVVIGGLGFMSYKIIERTLGPEALVNQFVKAIKEEDVTNVMAIINENPSKLKVDQQSTAAFIDIIKEDSFLLDDMAQELHKQVKQYKQYGTIQAAVAASSNQLVELKKQGKKWFLFDRYQIEIKPYYVTVTTNYEDAVVYINDEKAGILEEEETVFGPYPPGEYKIKAVSESEYAVLEDEKTATLQNAKGNKWQIHVNLEETYVYPMSNYDDAILFVNGKSTGLAIGEISEFGPVAVDGSITLHVEKEFPVGKIKSDEVVINKQGDIYLPINYEEVITRNEGVSSMRETELKTEVEPEKAAEVFEDTPYVSDEEAIRETLFVHYNSISNKDFSTAYEKYSRNLRRNLDYEKWLSGFEKTIRDDLHIVTVRSIDGKKSEAYFEMTSYDKAEDGRILVQEWEGIWQLIMENGEWYLHKPKIQMVDKRYTQYETF